MKLSPCIKQFFSQYLHELKGVSPNTIKAYRDTFTLFLPFAATYHGIKIESLRVEHLKIKLILGFLDHIEKKRSNAAITRNHRLAVLKSLGKMISLLHSEHKDIADKIINIPQKRTQKRLLGFFSWEEFLKVLEKVDIKKKEGFRNHAILHLLYDSGARASEIASLKLDYFEPAKKTLAILGKANRYRQVTLWPKTVKLMELYISRYRPKPKPIFHQSLFINQRGEELTRHGVNRVCKKYLVAALSAKRLKDLDPAHGFRHSCAINMLSQGHSITDIKNHLGHQNIQSTMVYLHLSICRKRETNKKFVEYTSSSIKNDPKLDELIDWENKEDILAWLDSL